MGKDIIINVEDKVKPILNKIDRAIEALEALEALEKSSQKFERGEMKFDNSPEDIQRLHDFLKSISDPDPSDMKKSYIHVDGGHDAYIESFYIHFADIDVDGAFVELEKTGKINFHTSPDNESHIVKIEVND